MRTLRLFFLVLILVLSSLNLFAQLQDTCYLPLAIGTKWLYLKNTTYYTTTVNPTGSYELDTIEVNDDSLVNNKHYFKWGNTWLFYDNSSQIVYASFPDNIYPQIFCNFSLNSGQSFKGFWNDCFIFEKDISVFDSLYSTKGFFYSTFGIIGAQHWREQLSFINHIGMAKDIDTSEYHKIESTLIGFYSADTTLATSIQDSSFPTILEPDIFYSSIDAKIKFNVSVNHKFSFIGVPNSTDFSFINSVDLSYFYFNGVDTIQGGNNYFSVSTTLNLFHTSITKNSDLLENGYDLYYRISATDKALIPHTSYYPENGYVKVADIVNVKNEDNLQNDYSLLQNYPNPFNPSTNINFCIPKQEFVSLKLYDVLGKEVTTLINEELNAGNYTKTWDANKLSSGVYFYKLQAGKFSETKKMVLFR